MATRPSPADEKLLMTELWDPQISDDLEAFVLFAYPWGKAGTPLEHMKGPRTWQRDDLQEITEHIRNQKHKIDLEIPPSMWQKATTSGRGPGKSALVSWLADWMLTTRLGSTTIITANTEPQLKSRTFAELGRWTTMLINAHWWDSTTLSIFPAKWFKALLESQLKIDTGYYYIQGQLWSEENPDAFAGVHNHAGVMLLMDEASGIPNSIFNVSEGFFTEPILNRYWNVYSNPRRNSGAFFDIFHNEGAMAVWRRRQIDSRTVEGTDRAVFDKLIAQHGIDSDVVRVEVLGQFPKSGSKQFISNDAVSGAQTRELVQDAGAALVMGVDIARFGDDSSVARFRQGRDARSIPPVRWKGFDTVQSAEKIAGLIDTFNPDGVFIDSGAGTGVIDILKSKGYRVTEVFFGGKASSHEWANKRTEMYAEARDWLPGGCLDGDPLLFTDLTAVDYDYYGQGKDKIILEPKEVLKGKIGRSPDDGDAFVLTFAAKVARRDLSTSRFRSRNRIAIGVDENQFGE